jgi:NAD(P)-dependent dehydrogenase (short-subunit alcohol dehydrogenase family)
VTNERSRAQFFKQTLHQHGAIHGLINCAGVGPSAKVVGKEGIHDLALFNKV